MSLLAYDSLPSPDKRFELKEVIGTGVCSKVYKAIDKEANDRTVAIKIQRYEKDMIAHINEEYRVLRDFSSHTNLPDFYGVYRKKFTTIQSDEVWFVLEYCEGGSVIDIIRSLQTINRRVSEEHIAYILKETAKAVLHLHENHVIHRDIRGANILMTHEGEIKLCDFGLSRDTKTTSGKRSTCIGSPSWMAPEMVASAKSDKDSTYSNRADVWALGITAIELADGNPPFADMHPTRAMFQILRNPPPTLYRQSTWSQSFNDFISECLEKNPDHRPFIVEMMEHPFFTDLPSNDYHLSQEIKSYLNDVETMNFPQRDETIVCKGYIQTHDNKMEKMYHEDLAALERLTDETVLDEIKARMKTGETYSFVGDVLLSINPNREFTPTFDRKYHNRYMFKSRSDNAPHVFSVADSAYQDMLHHEEQQHIIFSGESSSGKTTNMRLCFQHLIFQGEGNAGIQKRVNAAVLAVNALTHAGTPLNNDSTRCVLQLQVTFGSTGKLSGIIFWTYVLEKLRVSSIDMSQSNFHIFYYFYDAMEAEERLKDFDLESGRHYRYLRIPDAYVKSKLNYVRDDYQGNAAKFKEFEQALMALDIPSDTLEAIYRIIAAILMLGDVRFKESDHDRKAAFVHIEIVEKVARLLKVDEKKLQWSLLNYCLIIKGHPEKRRHSPDEARDARDVLASTIYSRLVDFIVNTINHKLALNRAIFGDVHSIILTDLFGFECFPRNSIDQLIVNSVNEQMQYHFNQRMFVWEMIEQEEEQVPVTKLHFYDNKLAVDHLMNNPKGLFHVIDDASRGQYTHEYMTDSLNNRKSPYVQRFSAHEFTVAHYTGKVTYDARDMIDKNRDFLPPETVETMRTSHDDIIRICFTNQLSKSGNLTMALNEQQAAVSTKSGKKSRWGAVLVTEKAKNKKMNTLSRGQYSQIHKMRTLSSVFRAASLELLKGLSIVANSGGTFFVRCIRPTLDYREMGFNDDMVRQQLRAMAIVDTARARQKGYSIRIPFQEFLRRYKFLAFEFDENVELTKDNCRLLLIRLKMEGWMIGTTKVFLKYYNEEYLSRLYETQVKKIVKVQSMMRAFLAKKNVAIKFKQTRQDSVQKLTVVKNMDPEFAVLKIQSAFRGYCARKIYGPLINSKTGKIDIATAKFIEPFAARWKHKSVFQVLLQYRSVRHMDLVNFSQQVHIYNQRMVAGTTATSQCILLDKIDPKEINKEQLGPIRRAVWKMPFRLDEIPFFDTSFMCDPAQITHFTSYEEEIEPWDAPLRRRNNVSHQITSHLRSNDRRNSNYSDIDSDDGMIVNEPFVRDPDVPMRKIGARRYEYSPRPSIASPTGIMATREVHPVCYSPTPYSRSSVGNIRDEFSEQSIRLFDNKAAAFKKRSAPKPPVVDSFTSKLEQKLHGNKKGPAPQPKFPSPKVDYSYRPPKTDPIKELEQIGRKPSEQNLPADEPPFNFQGMLRKTAYNRNSMKRTAAGKLSISQGDLDNNNVSEPYVETSTSYSNVVFHSKASERPRSNIDVPKHSSNIGVPKQSSNGRKSSMDFTSSMDQDFADENENRDFIQEEIAPGIIMEGYATDL